MIVRHVLIPFLFISTLSVGQPSPVGWPQGKYVVDGLDCVKCGNRHVSERGKIIDFQMTGIANELDGDCEGQPGYDLLKVMSGPAAIKTYGSSWPRALRDRLRSVKQVSYGFVTCKKINYAQVLFVPGKDLYYFSEGSVVFRLSKTSPAGQ